MWTSLWAFFCTVRDQIQSQPLLFALLSIKYCVWSQYYIIKLRNCILVGKIRWDLLLIWRIQNSSQNIIRSAAYSCNEMILAGIFILPRLLEQIWTFPCYTLLLFSWYCHNWGYCYTSWLSECFYSYIYHKTCKNAILLILSCVQAFNNFQLGEIYHGMSWLF